MNPLLMALLAATALVPCSEIAAKAGAEKSPPEWIRVVPFGAWRGHAQGAFSVGATEAKQIVENFRRSSRELVIDYEHQSLFCEQNGEPAPAAGWIDRLELRDDGVWAHVRLWTARASAHLVAEEYRYLSPVLAWQAIDRVTGAEIGAALQSVALTNVPFLDGLAAIAARHNPRSPMDLKEIAKALGLAETATADEIRAAAIERGACLATACSALGLADPNAKAADIDAAGKRIALRAKLGDIVLRELKLDETKASEAETEARVCRELKHSGYVTFDEHTRALRDGAAKVEDLTDEQLVEQGIQKGAVTPALLTWARQTVKRDREGFMVWLRGATGVPVNPAHNPTAARTRTPNGEAALDDIQLSVCRQLDIDAKDYQKEARQ